jgi:hypothetical protein
MWTSISPLSYPSLAVVALTYRANITVGHAIDPTVRAKHMIGADPRLRYQSWRHIFIGRRPSALTEHPKANRRLVQFGAVDELSAH